MKLDVALLCDAVTVRDGLLHVLGGGVTVIGRPEFPSALGIQIALRVTFDDHQAAFTTSHKLEVALIDADDEQLALVGGELSFQPDDNIDPELPLSGVIAVPAQSISIPAPGLYRFIIRLEGEEAAVLPFRAVVGVPPQL